MNETIRVLALQQAVEYARNAGVEPALSPNEVVRAAEKFYAFLLGNELARP